jgi:hypothetical protein
LQQCRLQGHASLPICNNAGFKGMQVYLVDLQQAVWHRSQLVTSAVLAMGIHQLWQDANPLLLTGQQPIASSRSIYTSRWAGEHAIIGILTGM